MGWTTTPAWRPRWGPCTIWRPPAAGFRSWRAGSRSRPAPRPMSSSTSGSASCSTGSRPISFRKKETVGRSGDATTGLAVGDRGEPDPDAGALAGPRLQGGPAAVGDGDGLHDGQAQPAAPAAGAGQPG